MPKAQRDALALADLIAALQPIVKEMGDVRWKIESEASKLDSLQGLCITLAEMMEAAGNDTPPQIDTRV